MMITVNELYTVLKHYIKYGEGNKIAIGYDYSTAAYFNIVAVVHDKLRGEDIIRIGIEPLNLEESNHES